jgi:hypothetical protein
MPSSTHQHTLTHKNTKQRAISLSGSPNITMNLPTAHEQNQPLLASLGCSELDTRAQRLACLRALPAAAVAKALPWAWTIPGMNGLPLSPAGQGYYGAWGWDLCGAALILI